MPRPLLATIHISALRHNLAIAKMHAPEARAWAIVKAHAYGHGLQRAIAGFNDADGMALVEIDNAVRLREYGWHKPILLLEGFFDETDIPVLVQQQLQFAVHCNEQIAMLETVAANGGLQPGVDVHLKLNSGMNRLGFTPEVYRDAYRRLCAIPGVRTITMMTHFANADNLDHPYLSTAEQISRFQQATAGLKGERCVANSAADLLHTGLAFDWIRPGVMLYGASPGSVSAASLGLQPAMTLESRIIGVQNIIAGDAVGYGSRFVAESPKRVGVVACGYADGYPRHAPDGTPVIVDGVRTSVIGCVSMDMLAVDLTDLPQAGIGSHVELWGENLSIDEVASAAGTIGYELMCALAPRVMTQSKN